MKSLKLTILLTICICAAVSAQESVVIDSTEKAEISWTVKPEDWEPKLKFNIYMDFFNLDYNDRVLTHREVMSLIFTGAELKDTVEFNVTFVDSVGNEGQPGNPVWVYYVLEQPEPEQFEPLILTYHDLFRWIHTGAISLEEGTTPGREFGVWCWGRIRPTNLSEYYPFEEGQYDIKLTGGGGKATIEIDGYPLEFELDGNTVTKKISLPKGRHHMVLSTLNNMYFTKLEIRKSHPDTEPPSGSPVVGIRVIQQ